MKKILKILVVTLVLTQSSLAQEYDKSLVSEKTELNFAETEMRGIESGKMIYFVENDLKTITAYENGKLKWKTDVIAVCGKPRVGKSEIRYMKSETEKLFIIFGKHSFAEVDKKTGETKLIGDD